MLASGRTFAGNEAHPRRRLEVAPLPKALACRRVEITGPGGGQDGDQRVQPGADSYMTDFEDPELRRRENQIQGQIKSWASAIRRTPTLRAERQEHKLNDKIGDTASDRAAGISTRNTC